MSTDAPTTTYTLPASARALPTDLRRLLIRQEGLATLPQLADAGLTRSFIRWRLGHGWGAPLPGIVHVRDTALTPHQRCHAALLLAGPSGLITGTAAARIHGLQQPSGETVDVIVPRRCSARRVRWVTIRRTDLVDPRPRIVGGLRVVSVQRAVLDHARWVGDRRLAEAAVIEACQRRLTTPDALWRELTALGRSPGTAVVRQALAAVDSGAWSVAESDLVRVLRTSSVLPTPMLNPTLMSGDRRLTTPDVWFDDVALAVMVHSKAHHLMGDDWESTVSADADLTIAGAVVLGVAPTEIARAPEDVLRRIEAAYSTAAARPRPPGLRVAAAATMAANRP